MNKDPFNENYRKGFKSSISLEFSVFFYYTPQYGENGNVNGE